MGDKSKSEPILTKLEKGISRMYPIMYRKSLLWSILFGFGDLEIKSAEICIFVSYSSKILHA